MMRSICVLTASLFLCSCDDAGDPPPPDRGVIDQGPAESMCVMNPMTHVEIINACTAATSIKKTPVTPLRNADGSLPPLP